MARLSLVPLLLGGAGCAGDAPSKPATRTGDPVPLGKGEASAYVRLSEDGTPAEVGVRFSAGALEGLPTELNPDSPCFDVNGDGAMNVQTECLGNHAHVLSMPPEPELPIRWIGLDWNPLGHPPPGVYDRPHFDFHFYTVDKPVIDGIRMGPCAELIDCEDFEKARKPLAPRHMPPDYVEVGGAVGRMGNHLMDLTSAELRDPPAPFTATFLFGTYDGELIFLEPMITRAHLLSTSQECRPIKQPEAWARSGYYPTEYCIRNEGDGGTVVALSGLTKREAT